MNTFLAFLELPTRATQLGSAQGPDLTRYFTVLGILLVAIVALAFGFKKLFAGAMRAKAAKRHLAIVDLLPLGGKQRIAVVRCYDRTFALGLGDKEVALIAELDPVVAEGRGQPTPDRAERTEFASLLQRIQGRLAGAEGRAMREADAAGDVGRAETRAPVREEKARDERRVFAQDEAARNEVRALARDESKRVRELNEQRGARRVDTARAEPARGGSVKPAVQTASSQARGTSAPAETVGKHVRELLGTSGVLG